LTSIIRQLRLLLLGLWLGAAVFFGAAVAPALFNVLRGAGLANANELAGSIVTRLLGIINQGGFEIALFLFVTAFFVNRNQSRLARWAEVISLAIMAIMTGVGHWVIAIRMSVLRTAMQLPIDHISPDDPRRIAFDNLHRYSVLVLSVAMCAALAAFIFTRAYLEPSAGKLHDARN
jgi:Domain of unknown function (DUF4149)